MKYLTLLFFSFCFYTLWAQDGPQVLEILDPRMEILISKNAKIEILAEGFGWAEGPVWIPELNGILFSDVPNNKAYLWTEKKGLSLFLYPSGMTNHAPNNKSAGSNGLGLDSDGNLILCQHGDRSISRLNSWFFEEPKFENEIIAITGSIPNIFTTLAVIWAILVKSLAVGLMLID